jgi:hypothetical protein
MSTSVKNLLVLLLFISCSTTKNSNTLKVYQSAIYTKQEFLGNIPVDDNNNPLQKGYWLHHFIAVEVKGDKLPKWESLMINGKENLISFSTINDSTIYIGKEKNSLTDIFFSPKESRKLILVKVEDFVSEIQLLKPPFVLLGKLGEKDIKIIINSEPVYLETEAKP